MTKNTIRLIDGYSHHYLGESIHYEPAGSTVGWLCKVIKVNSQYNGDIIIKKIKRYSRTKFLKN